MSLIIKEVKRSSVNGIYQADDDGRGETYDVDYAYIKLANGKIKKIKSQKNWKVGNKLEKCRGQATVRVLP
jgi:hypothetical protein